MSNECGVVTKADVMAVIPASITITPNLYHNASGAVEILSSSAESSKAVFFSFETSWNVRGELNIDLTTSWNVGEGGYYWYRVESECGEVTCDDFGVERRECNKMTIVTTVSARSVVELCDTLANPRTNAPLVAKILSIRRYGRPMFRDQIQPGQCNTLEEVEFCHVPECLDYCIDTPPAPALLVSLEEPVTEPDSVDMLPETDVISVCGCDRASYLLPTGHSLGRSREISRFLRGSGLSLPEILPLSYRREDSVWSASLHLKGYRSSWTLLFSLGCRPDLWTFSLSVTGEGRRTRLVFDIPSELICGSGRPSATVQCYFDSNPSFLPDPPAPQVVDPPRTPLYSAMDRAEVFVDGIFVPYTVYYDGLGLFRESFWRTSPLEFDINPISSGRTRAMTLEGIA